MAKPELQTDREAKGLNLCRGAVAMVDQGLQARKEDRGQEEGMEGAGTQDYWWKSHWHLGYLGEGARHMPGEGRVAGLHLDGGCSDRQ